MARPIVTYNTHGKAKVQVMKVFKNADWYDVRRWTVQLMLESENGALDSSYTDADNRLVVPTDTCKHLCFVVAAELTRPEPENYALLLARRALKEWAHITKATVSVDQTQWERMHINGKPHPHSFVCARDVRTVKVISCRLGSDVVEGGLRDLLVLKPTGSGFADFWRDKYTVLSDFKDRILATAVTATWRFEKADGNDWDATYNAVRNVICDVFANTYSPSVQQTIYDISARVLKECPEVQSVNQVLPNLHHWPYDLKPFGFADHNGTFIATSDPHGQIEATVARTRAKL